MERFQKHLLSKGYELPKYGADGDVRVGGETFAAATKYLRDLIAEKGYTFYPNNPYWIRMSDDFTDKFTDYLLNFKDGKLTCILPATTKPGKYYVSNPVTVGGITGTGCVVAGQYVDSHEWVPGGKWGGGGFFRQIGTINVHRDGNKDNKLDKNIIQKAPSWYGFFMHAMGAGNVIWNWSAGCLGTAKALWQKYIAPNYTKGQKVSMTIFEV